MVTPTNGTLSFKLADGSTEKHNFYIADAVGTICKIAILGKAGTGSPQEVTFPQNAKFIGASIATGPTVVFTLDILVGGKSTGNTIAIADNLNTLATREMFDVRIPAGAQFRLVEQ